MAQTIGLLRAAVIPRHADQLAAHRPSFGGNVSRTLAFATTTLDAEACIGFELSEARLAFMFILSIVTDAAVWPWPRKPLILLSSVRRRNPHMPTRTGLDPSQASWRVAAGSVATALLRAAEESFDLRKSGRRTFYFPSKYMLTSVLHRLKLLAVLEGAHLCRNLSKVVVRWRRL